MNAMPCDVLDNIGNIVQVIEDFDISDAVVIVIDHINNVDDIDDLDDVDHSLAQLGCNCYPQKNILIGKPLTCLDLSIWQDFQGKVTSLSLKMLGQKSRSVNLTSSAEIYPDHPTLIYVASCFTVMFLNQFVSSGKFRNVELKVYQLGLKR